MSSSSKMLVSFSSLLCFVLLFQTTIGGSTSSSSSNAFLFHFCSSSDGNFTHSSPYQASLTNLLESLAATNSSLASTGFSLARMSYHDATAYGLALCRGDVSSHDCESCAVNAGNKIRKLCPNNKGAVIWYDDCLLKYSSHNFFGKIDEKNLFYMWNLNNVSNPKLFNQKTSELLTELSEKAVGAVNLFATGESKLDAYTTLYGLVQCTRDLSRSSCKKCLEDAVSRLPDCCDGKQGGRVVGGSCNFRYEIYPFVESQV